MRYIAISLLLANVAFLAWVQWRPQAVQESPPPRELLNTGITLVEEFQAQSAAVPREDNNSAADTLQCSRVAGLVSLDGANSLMAQARDMGLEAALELSGAALPPHYRVYLPPASSRAIATITLDGLAERLSDAGLGFDSYLITRGELENAIALGVFALQSNAEQVRSQVAELGYQPRIEEIPRSDGDILVWLKPTAGERISDSEWLDLSAERPNLSRSENLCQTIAQAPQFP